MNDRVSQAARGLFFVFVLVCFPTLAFATGSITLAWDPNTEPDIAGYTVYYRSADNYNHGTTTVETPVRAA